jgi:hypothetical protein
VIDFRDQPDVGRGQLPRRMAKPVIYFAGRMDGSKYNNDWRNAVEGFDGLHMVELNDNVDCDTRIDCGTFWYGGPFISGKTGGHTSGHTSFTEEHQAIWDVDKLQIERADLFLAYIDDAQAFGTLVEIGYAAALGKKIVLGFSERMRPREYADLWLCRMTAAKVYWGSSGDFWNMVRAEWICQRQKDKPAA